MIRWVEPDVSVLAQILHNPAYAGMLAFGRRVADPTRGRDKRGRYRKRMAKPEEQIRTSGHHEGYITEEQFEEYQRILALNAPSKTRRNPGPGSALSQGIIFGLHREWAMSAFYNDPRLDGTRSHSYQCVGDVMTGGAQCGRIPRERVDDAVVRAMMAKLAPPALEAIREGLRQAMANDRAEHARQRTEQNRMRQKADDLEARYLAVDPSNRLVARDLEAKLEAAKRDLQAHERQDGARKPAPSLDEASFEELVRLCRDFDAIWSAQTTTDLDRKQILRAMIDRVVMVDKTPERLLIEIRWADGSPPAVVEVTRNRHAHAAILELAAEGVDAEGIAAILNERGIKTTKGRKWQKRTVAQFLRRRDCSGSGRAAM